MARLLRDEFDRSRNFVVKRPFRVNGKDLGAGETFDPAAVTTRRLRQLYDSRQLEMLPTEGAPPRHTNGGTDFSVMSEFDLRNWLTEHGAVPRFGASFKQLLIRARRVAAQPTAGPS